MTLATPRRPSERQCSLISAVVGFPLWATNCNTDRSPVSSNFPLRRTPGAPGTPDGTGKSPLSNRAWLTTLGHDAALFDLDATFPGAAEYRSLLLGGIESAMGKKPFCR